MQPDHDALLLEHLSAGDDEAFWAIWQRYRRRLYDVCFRRMSGVHADAADAVSRSMMVAHDRLPTYAASIENVEAWLTRLTCNVCLDIHRERKRDTRGQVDLSTPDSKEEPYVADSPTPEEELLQSEACRAIAAAIDALPQMLRDAAQLRFLQELDYDVVAARLQITEGNARKRIQQARAMLCERLGKEVTLRRAARPDERTMRAARMTPAP
jgi:RNA polymerase sigma-70 factor (ECF subfamily)